MNCNVHSTEPACGTCAHCGKFYCTACLVDVGGRYLCNEGIQLAIADKQPAQQQPPMVFMNAGGGAAVANQKRGVNHLLHFILTMLTGVWIFVWIFVAITNRN